MARPMSITRRTFLNSTAMAFTGSWATRVGLADEPSDSANKQPTARRRTKRGPVWVATFCQEKLRTDSPEAMIAKVLGAMHEVLPQQPDILCLPECFHAANVNERPPLAELAEQPPGRYSRPFAEFAKQHQVNIICPIYTLEGGRIFNAAVVIDRTGEYVGEYRKINPTDGEIQAGVTPGPIDPPVFSLDCATIGIQICFDVNWPENWRRLGDKGAEIVFWPSAFAGGQMLNSHAWMNKYYVVSSTRIRASTMVDPLGDTIESTGRFGTWLCRPLNLDYAVIQGWQDINKLNAVRAAYGRAVDVRIKHVEALALLRSLSTEKSAQEICREFEIETSREMLKRNTLLQERHRGALHVQEVAPRQD
jgi:beta-ureidopropionase